MGSMLTTACAGVAPEGVGVASVVVGVASGTVGCRETAAGSVEVVSDGVGSEGAGSSDMPDSVSGCVWVSGVTGVGVALSPPTVVLLPGG